MLKSILRAIFGEEVESYSVHDKTIYYSLYNCFFIAGIGILAIFLKYVINTGFSYYTLFFSFVMVALGVSLTIYRKTGNVNDYIRINIPLCFLALIVHHITMGGFAGTSGSYIWGMLAIITSVIYYDNKTTRKFFTFYIALFFVLYFYDVYFATPVTDVIKGNIQFFAINILGIIYMVYSTFTLFINGLQYQYDRSQLLVKELEASHEKISKAMDELRSTQNQLIQAEKMVSLGTLIAGIAHEINTPIGAIRASSDFIYTTYSEKLSEINKKINSYSNEQLEIFNALILQSFKDKTYKSALEKRKIKKTYSNIMESSLVKDTDNIAALLMEMDLHMEDDIDFITKVCNVDFFEEMVDDAYLMSSLYKSAQNISLATDKISKIIFSLKSFSHIDSLDESTVSGIEEDIDIVLTLYHNQLKHGIEVLRDYTTNNYAITCFPSELNQVWTNLIQNSVHAMDGVGTLTISVNKDDTNMYVSFRDTGCGITDNDLARMFEPFYTTKATGEGTGLGLDISKRIIEKHNGLIEVESILGEGTVFKITLPLSQHFNATVF